MARDFVSQLLDGRAKGKALVCLPADELRALLGEKATARKPAAAPSAAAEPRSESARASGAEAAAARAPRTPRAHNTEAAGPAQEAARRSVSPPRKEPARAPRTEAEPEDAVREPAGHVTPPRTAATAATTAAVHLGTTEGLHARPYFWQPAAEVNPFLLAVGGSGSGKTYALRLIAEDLAAAGVAVVLIDVHGDLAVPGFETQRLGPAVGLNPLALPSGEAPQRHAAEVVGYLERLVPTLGTRQAYRLRRVLDQAYQDKGITASSSTWTRRTPTFADVVAQLEAAARDPAQRAERTSLSGLLASLDRVFGDPVYSAAKQILPARLVSGRLRLDLTGLGDTAQKLVSDAVLRQIFGALRAAGPLPSGRGLRVFVICDEAAQVAGAPSVAQIFREARKFGFGLAMASQLADDFGEELRGNAGTLLVLRANSAREIAKNAKELDVPEAQLRALRRPGQGLIRTSAGTERLQLRAPGTPRASAKASCGCSHRASEPSPRTSRAAASRTDAEEDTEESEPARVTAEVVRDAEPKAARPLSSGSVRGLLEAGIVRRAEPAPAEPNPRPPEAPAAPAPAEPSDSTPALAEPADSTPASPDASEPPESAEALASRRRSEGRVWIASQFKKRPQPTAGQQARWAPIVVRKLQEATARADERARGFWEGVRDWLSDAATAATEKGTTSKQPAAVAAIEEPERPSAPVPDRATRAAKLRKLAATVGAQIDKLENSGTRNQNPTRRRAGIIASQDAEAEHLRRVRAALLGLADAIEGHCEPAVLQQVDLGAHGCVPPSLEGVESRALVEDLLRRKLWPRPILSEYAVKDLLSATEKLRGVTAERRLAQQMLRRCERNACAYDTVEDAEALERLLAAAVKAGDKTLSARNVREQLLDFKRAARAGLRSQAEWDQARADLQRFTKPAQSLSPIERQIRDAERELIGRKFPGYVPTPRTLVERMVAEADLRPGMSVLEPSAGKGDIAVALRAAGVVPDVIEPQPALRQVLELKGFRLVGRDFLEFTEPYDRIVMNPPFEDGADMAHVRHAYDLLKPGGRLVAIMSEGPFFRTDKRAQAFRLWLEEVHGEAEKLPAGTFLSSDVPTGVSTRIVVLDKREKPETKTEPAHPEVVIEYGALRVPEGGAIPVLRQPGRSWAWLRRKPVDVEQARAEARADAERDALGYVGDWTVRVREVSDPASADSSTTEEAEVCPTGTPACSLGLQGGVCGVPAQLLLATSAGGPAPRVARYCLTSARRLIASHNPLRRTAQGFAPNRDYPEGVQERPYDRDPDERMKVEQIAEQMEPALLANTNPDGINGPPVVTQRPADKETGRAIVLGGNGRTMAAQLHYASGRDSVLRAFLLKNAREFGFTRAQVAAIPDPILVRVVDTSGDPAELRELVRLLNVGLTQELGQRARASAEASRLSDEAIEILAEALAGDDSVADYLASPKAAAFAAALQRAGIITERNRKLYVEPDGTFTRDGKQFVERLLTAAVIQDAQILDTMPDNLRETLSRAAPWLVVAAAYGEGWDLRPDLTRAAEDLRRMRIAQIPTAEAYLRQVDAFDPPASSKTPRGPQVLRLVAALQGRPLKFARFAQRWAQLSRQHLEAQGALFASEQVTPAQALVESAAVADVSL